MIHPLRPLARSIGYATASSLSFALLAGAGTALLAGSALAAETAAQVRIVAFDVPAGPLDQALGRFGRQAGIPLSTNASLTAGKHSTGVQGRYGVDEGLARLLAGTGLSSARQADGSYLLIERDEAGDALEIGATSISGSAALGATTEGSGSYTTGTTNAATKLNLSLRETPQSVTVMTRQRMDDQNLTTIGKVLEQTPGLTPAREGSEGTGYSYYSSRGFAIASYQIDGIIIAPEIMQGFGNGSAVNLDSALYDHVSVVRGATGLLTGAGDPSASVNLVRKKPTHEFQAHVLGSAGRWDRYRSEMDVSGPLSEQGHIRGRLVGAYEKGRSWQERQHNERSVTYGVLDIDLTENTTLSAGFEVYNGHADDAGYGSFQLSDAAGNKLSFPRSQNAAATWSYEDMERQSLFASLLHRFDNGWQTTLALNHVEVDNRADRGSAQMFVAAGGASDVAAQRFVYTPKQIAADFYANGPYQLFGREHELMFGLNYFDMERDDPYYNRVLLPIANVHTFDGNIARPNFDLTQNGSWHQDSTTLGSFLATRLRPTDELSVILGARVSDYENVSGYSAWGDSGQQESGVVTPYAGVVYDLTGQLSLYASYTSIFKPQSQGTQDASGKTLEPETGDNYELGLKGEFMDGRLNTSVAVFEMQKENVAEADGFNLTPSGGQAYTAAKGVRVRGFELEIAGEVLTGWSVSGGYTLLRARDDSGTRDGTGTVPRHQAKVFTTYKLPGDWSKLTVGGGATWQSTTRNPGVDAWQPGTAQNYVRDSYTVVNLMTRYQATEQLELVANLDNLFDRKYLMNNWHHTYGAPRNLTVSARYSF